MDDVRIDYLRDCKLKSEESALGPTEPTCFVVYDLNLGAFDTFDMILFYGMLYHLRNPTQALEAY